MNNLEQHVVSLELSKKLKELGIKQESQFYWVLSENLGNDNFYLWDHKPTSTKQNWSAYLATELLEILPYTVYWNDDEKGQFDNLKLRIDVSTGHVYSVYYTGMLWTTKGLQIENSLPNALAKMLIYLKENNLL